MSDSASPDRAGVTGPEPLAWHEAEVCVRTSVCWGHIDAVDRASGRLAAPAEVA